jgi:hypothetical protein
MKFLHPFFFDLSDRYGRQVRAKARFLHMRMHEAFVFFDDRAPLIGRKLSQESVVVDRFLAIRSWVYAGEIDETVDINHSEDHSSDTE